MKYINLTQKDFDWCRMTAKQIEAFPSFAKESIAKKYDAIKSLKKEERNFQNTIVEYEKANDEESVMLHQIHTLGMVSDKKEIREVARKSEVEFSKYAVDMAYDIEMYQAIRDYTSFNFKKEKKNLDEQDVKLVRDILLGFKRMGFELDKKEREKLKKIDKKISELENEYDARLAEDNSYILCTEDEVAGVPENIINSFEVVDGKYKVTTQYPEYGPFMRYAENRSKRKELYKLFNNAGGVRNVTILKTLIKLRKEKSDILGYANHARYRMENRMAKHEKNAYKMTYDLIKSLGKKVAQDKKDLELVAKEKSLKSVESYDDAFLSNIIKERDYKIDDQEVRQYFQLENVMDFMFSHFGKLFGFSILQKDINLWHKDAKLFAVVDKKSKKEIAYLALDLFPREGKFGHACMMPIIEGAELGGNTYRSPFAALICNFSKPHKTMPSLLTLGEVETLFHEFGHGLHGLLTTAKYTTHAGTNVVWDFVEMPSQIMEQWVMEKSILKKMGKHYKTGLSMPSDMIDKIIKVKHFRSGTFYTRQSVQGLLDLDLYTGVATDPVKHFHTLMQKHLSEIPKDILFVSRFSHIIGGYDAGYYSYLWAERLAHDVYSVFKKEGLTNSKVGARYKKEILSRGASRDELESVRAFLGRAPSNNAFIESLG